MPAVVPSDRRFVAMPALGPEPEPPRPIWDVEPGAVFVALGVLLERGELETVFLEIQREDRSAHREDVLLRDAVRLCAAPCRFAGAIEGLLEARTNGIGGRVGSCPMAELASWWLGAKDAAEGRQLAALLWNLARDRRWIVGPLFDSVCGDIWVRALRLLGERR